MNRLFRTIALGAAISLLVFSCDKKQLATVYDNQEKNIEAIANSIASSAEDATVERNNGSVRVTVVKGEGAPLDEKGAVAFYYAGYFISGSSLNNTNLFATNYETFAKSARWNITDSTAFDIATLRLGEDEIVEGLKNGLVGVKGGEECYILFSGQHGFGKKKIGNLPSYAALAYHLWIKSVSNE